MPQPYAFQRLEDRLDPYSGTPDPSPENPGAAAPQWEEKEPQHHRHALTPQSSQYYQQPYEQQPPATPSEKTPAAASTYAVSGYDNDYASAKWTNTATEYSAGPPTVVVETAGDRAATHLESRRRRFLPTWLVAVMTLASAAATVWYSTRAMLDSRALPPSLSHGPGMTVLVVNVLSHLVAFLCLTLYTETMEALRWALACRRVGVPLTTFLAMSRATPLMGVLHLCRVRGAHQFWAVTRFVSYVADVLLSLVLISELLNPYPRASAAN
jgi:hypothetical protein